MSRSYRNVRPRKHFVYTVDDLMTLYGVARNTVSNWVKEGLNPSDGTTPYMFNGSEVKRFHDARRLTSEAALRLGEFKCLACKSRMFPDPKSLARFLPGHARVSLRGTCSSCGKVVSKIVNETDCDRILKCAVTNTNLACLDEGYDVIQAGIGNDSPPQAETWHVLNDRILHDWLQLAGRWDDKTVSAKLTSIRLFEAFCGGKAFAKVTRDDVVAFRDRLKASVLPLADEPLSISTVRHHASHLKSFFEWLVEQKGYQGLNRALPRYFELPKRFEAAGLVSKERQVPTLEEAIKMVEGMPCRTTKERRDRAMVAVAFLAALRADTITTLKVKHIEVSNKVVVQDAKISRTKNGKSLRIKFFPLPSIFVEVVGDWQEELIALGFEGGDALFPDERYLVKRDPCASPGNIPSMSSTHAVTSAFKTASRPLRKQFSPHAAKHFIGTLSLKRCKSPEHLKIWSVNMGHENEEVTLRHYKNIPNERRFEVFEEFYEEAVDTSDDKDLMLRYHEHRLVKGTPEFQRAKKLVQERLAEGDDDVDEL